MRPLDLALAFCCLLPTTALANEGDLIQNVNLPVTGFGVSVAVDCAGNVYYTLAGDTHLYKMDKDGVLLDTFEVGLEIDEIAYDVGRDQLWGMLHNSNPIDVYSLTLAGAATFEFTSATNSVGTFRDGIAFDAGNIADLNDDSLWLSGDVSDSLDNYALDGTFIRNLVPLNAAGGPLGTISGVTVGVGDLLYLGRDGFVEIVQVQKSDGTFLQSFTSPGGARDEGLECDPVNFAPLLALWSREFNSPGFCSVIELEPNTCACGGAPDPNNPPSCNGQDQVDGSVGAELVLSWTGLDPDGDALNFSVSGLPAGATVSPNPLGGPYPVPLNVSVTWTPANNQVGDFMICVTFTDPDGESVTCCTNVTVSECHLLLADGPGSDLVTIGMYTFSTQVSGLRSHQPVLLDDIPSFVMQVAPRAGHAQGSNAKGMMTAVVPVDQFVAQVVMFNPEVFPANPEQSTPGLAVTLWSNGTATALRYGQSDGMLIHIETFVAADGTRYYRFPFTILGL